MQAVMETPTRWIRKLIPGYSWLYFGLSPLPVTVANEGFGWDPLLKM